MRKYCLILLLLSGWIGLAGQNSMIDSLRDAARALPADTHKVLTLSKLSWYLHFNYPDSAEYYAYELLELTQKLNWTKGLAMGYNNLAANEITKGDFPSSRVFFLQAADAALSIPDYRKAATYLINTGYAYIFESNHDSALVYIFKGIEVIEQNNLQDSLYSGYTALAKVYNFLEKYDEAVIQYKKAFEVAKNVGNNMTISSTQASLGRGYLRVDSLELAIAHSFASLQLARSFNDSSFNGYNYQTIADAWFDQDSLDHAYEYMEKAALAYSFAGAKNEHALTQVYNNMSIVNIKWKKYREALHYARLALANSIGIGNPELLSDAHESKAKSFAGLGQYDSAYVAFQSYNRWQDSLNIRSQKKAATDAEALYQNEKSKAELAEKELLISRQQNRYLTAISIFSLVLLLGGIGFFVWRNAAIQEKRAASHQLALEKAESEKLRELDQLKSRFFANISHEFRTPLTLILGPLEQLISGKLQQDSHTFFHMMYRNANRLLQLINQLLDLSKLESGRLQLQMSQGDILGFLVNLSGNFESLADSKQIHFTRSFPSGAWIVNFDPDKLEKIVVNLLSNAFKFTPDEGRVSMEVEAHLNRINIEISDTGIGMTEDEQAHIFDRFYQIEGKQYEGTGIGLALVYELSKLMDAEISVSSSPGQGSRFLLSIPVDAGLGEEALISEEHIQKKIRPQERLELSAPKLTDRPIMLIVDDNEDVRSYIKSCFLSDYVVHEAGDGKEGLEKARNLIPDIIISDVMMPVMNGNEFTRQIKSAVHTAHIPVILLTAKAGMNSKIMGLKLGADDYVSKPFHQEELLTRAANLISQRRKIREHLGREIVRLNPNEIMLESVDQQFLKRAIEVVETYMGDESFSIEDMGREVGMSRATLHRKLKALTNQSPSIFLRTLRLKRAHQILDQGAANAAETSYLVGFSSPAYFSKCFKDQFGYSPSMVNEGEIR